MSLEETDHLQSTEDKIATDTPVCALHRDSTLNPMVAGLTSVSAPNPKRLL